MKWEPRNNYPDLVKAQFIHIPPRVKAGYEAEEVWFFGEQNNHAPAPVASLGPPSTGILKMPKAPNRVMHSGCVETDEGFPALAFSPFCDLNLHASERPAVSAAEYNPPIRYSGANVFKNKDWHKG